MVCSSNGEDTALSRQRCEFDSRTDYKNNAGERVEARSVKPLLVGSIPTNGTKNKRRRYSSIGQSRTLISSRLWVQVPLSVQNADVV